jgi:hypothetical protein
MQAARPYIYASPAPGVIALFCRVQAYVARLSWASSIGWHARMMTGAGDIWPAVPQMQQLAADLRVRPRRRPFTGPGVVAGLAAGGTCKPVDLNTRRFVVDPLHYVLD